MPFLDKLTDKLGELMKEKLGGSKDHDEHSSKDSHEQYDSHGEPYAPPPDQHSYGYSDQPPLPPGWEQVWDHNAQRYYYLERATGRTQWEFPNAYPGETIPGQHYDSHGSYGHEAQHGSYHGEEKKDGHTGMALAGGVAVGAVGGAWAAHEYGEHQDEEAAAAAASNTAYQPPPTAPGDDTVYIPAEAAGDSDVESAAEDVASEREDVQDAQEELAEASSESDREEAREELEEEQEELEEANEDLEEKIED